VNEANSLRLAGTLTSEQALGFMASSTCLVTMSGWCPIRPEADEHENDFSEKSLNCLGKSPNRYKGLESDKQPVGESESSV
jgi:hypothetical protein